MSSCGEHPGRDVGSATGLVFFSSRVRLSPSARIEAALLRSAECRRRCWPRSELFEVSECVYVLKLTVSQFVCVQIGPLVARLRCREMHTYGVSVVAASERERRRSGETCVVGGWRVESGSRGSRRVLAGETVLAGAAG